ncbi:MAG: FCD domain-containing protein [Novosphingobium sp.]|uniref:FadR/GntR family transcriptional regulator n=1 Tax=Tsuneonella sp. CC-YZS046 TaxID=3042152 RepID=UPI002D76AE16|nr:FCD domain-containing protein [Tsuneonella sp. CC-YZS046]WRO67254.1 FCD domain-containing protein [Tsuneonella sp. CC-YZS046]
MNSTSLKKRPAAQKERVFEKVRDAVLADIKAGELAPGDRLPSERELSSKYSASRSAVREGLRALETSGVLRFAKGTSGGAFVRERSADGIARSLHDMIILGRMPLADIMVVRRSLLLLAIDLAVERATEEDFARLDANIEEMAAAIATGDPSVTTEPVMRFNRLLGKSSHNPVLELVIDTVSAIMAEVLNRLGLPTVIDLVSPRRVIVAHLRNRDADSAKEAFASHLSVTTRYVLERADLEGPAI